MASGRTAAFSGSSLQFVHEDPDKSQMLGANGDGPDFDGDEDDDCEESDKRHLDEPPPKKKTKGRVKIKMEFIENKLRRYTTFSKRKTGIMKKAYELSTLTGTQVMLLVASETGHVYTFATPKLQPMITSESGKALIQTCLNTPDSIQMPNRSRVLSSGFEESDLSYGSPEEDQPKQVQSPTLLTVSSTQHTTSAQHTSSTQHAPSAQHTPSTQHTSTTMAQPTSYPPAGLAAFRGTSIYPYLKGEAPRSPSASGPPALGLAQTPPPLSQLLQASAVSGATIPGSSGMMVADHGQPLNGELYGPPSIMPGLVATKRPMLSSGAVLYDPGLYHELSTQSIMANPGSALSVDSH